VALTAQQKVAIRDHLCVPFAGIPFSQYTSGLRTILTVGQLESYMNLLQVEEECRLTGYPFGIIKIFGTPAVNDKVTAVVNRISISYTVKSADLLAAQPLASIANALATAINISGAGVQAATGSISTADLPPAALPAFGQVTITNPTTFTLTASATGLVAVVDPAGNGQTYPQPNFVVNSGVTTVYGYINICDYLLSRVGQADAFLSFEKADVVTFRKYEIEKRIQLYDFWRKKMGVALSVGSNPAGTEGMGSGFGIIA
jgi:hypothetical protein